MMNDEIRHVRIFFTNGYGPMLSAPMHLDKMLAASNGNPEHVFRLVEVTEWNELADKLVQLSQKATPAYDEVQLAKFQKVMEVAAEVVEAYATDDKIKLGKFIANLDTALEQAGV